MSAAAAKHDDDDDDNDNDDHIVMTRSSSSSSSSSSSDDEEGTDTGMGTTMSMLLPPSSNPKSNDHYHHDHDDDDNIMVEDEEILLSSSQEIYKDNDDVYDYDSDDESESEKDKKRGWFSRLLFRRRQNEEEKDVDDDDDDDDDASDDDDEDDESYYEEELDVDHDVVNYHDHDNENDGEDTNAILKKEDDNITNQSSYKEDEKKTNYSQEDVEQEEEARLMAEAIQRVRQRIQDHGGNLYNVLSEEDRALVDELDRHSSNMDPTTTTITTTDESIILGCNSQEDKITENYGGSNAQHNTEENGNSSVAQRDQIFDNNSQHQDQETYDGDNNDDNEDDDDEEEDELPTLDEQRSLLTLAAEHDRVDVIQSLLEDSSRHDSIIVEGKSGYDMLLTGVPGSNYEDSLPSFVPPPLHVAVAHGSVNAASCLLRMGADPSIRPSVITSMDGHRGNINYKKYHDMSAWELAFGVCDVIQGTSKYDEDGHHGDGNEDTTSFAKVASANEPHRGGRWFGFGSSNNDKADDYVPTSNMDSNKDVNHTIQKPKRKRRQPLNIAPAKLDGIRHAFISEALRAIGANEVHRLEQLLDAGMDPNLEVVVGKTLLQFAQDLDAVDCCDLLSKYCGENGLLSDSLVVNSGGGDKLNAEEPSNKITEATPSLHSEDFERTSGLSIADLRILISENRNLISQLTTCRDDLASETAMCRSLLSDNVSATGGGGVLTSHSLLTLVRTLKEQRQQSEEALSAWHSAWEEREDELNFFWEEVLDESLRNELEETFDQLNLAESERNGDSLFQGIENTREELVKHFVEVDTHVNSLRASITNLADDCAKAAAEIGRRGMSGALSLTRTLRAEVKEIEQKLIEARVGEQICRKKIEIIQQRIDEVNDENDTSPEKKDGDDDSIIEDFQLRMIVQHHDAKVESGEERELSPLLVDQDRVHSTSKMLPSSLEEEHPPCASISVDKEDIEVENTKEGVTEVDPNERLDHNDIMNEKDPTVVASTNVRSSSICQNENLAVQPSQIILNGMSTAIVVHTGKKYGSLSSQIWEILRMIVGMNRTSALTRSCSHHSDENHPHIMVV